MKVVITVNSQKYAPLFICYFEAKVGAQTLNLFAHTTNPVPHNVIAEINNHTTTATAFWKNGSFSELVLREISRACVDTKLRIEVTCFVSEDTHTSSSKNLCGKQTRL